MRMHTKNMSVKSMDLSTSPKENDRKVTDVYVDVDDWMKKLTEF